MYKYVQLNPDGTLLKEEHEILDFLTYPAFLHQVYNCMHICTKLKILIPASYYREKALNNVYIIPHISILTEETKKKKEKRRSLVRKLVNPHAFSM